MAGTAVIIPFFQRTPGLLRAAVRSVLAQEDAGPITMIVCDDGSPLPAADELASFTIAEQERIVLIRQENGGAGAARNAALDAMPPDTEWIAFLDSDDRWRPRHLARAIAALREGHDLCFADVRREHEAGNHFQNAGFEPSLHESLGAATGLYRLVGDFLTLNLRLSPVSISSVVMRASTLGDLRFAPKPVEDLRFWFEVSRACPRVAFDATLQVDYGRGNITVTDGWRSSAELRMCLHYHAVFTHVARSFALSAEQRSILQRRVARNRGLFAQVMLAHFRDGRLPSGNVVWRFAKLDPALARALVATAASLALTRLAGFSRLRRASVTHH